MALLAEHGEEIDVSRLPVEGLDPKPRHLPAFEVVLLPDDGHVVLDVAGGNARGTAVAKRQVDGHGPPVLLVLVLRVEAFLSVVVSLVLVGGIGNQPPALLGRGAGENGDGRHLSGFFDPDPLEIPGRLPRPFLRPQRGGIHEVPAGNEDPLR